MASLKRKRLSLSKRYKSEVDSGTKLLKVAEKYGVLRNTISTWLLTGNKEKIKVAFQSIEVSTKRKNVRVGQNENLEKELFDWFKRMRMDNLTS